MTSLRCAGRTLRLPITSFRPGHGFKPWTTFNGTGQFRASRSCAQNVGRTRFLSSTAVPSVTKKTWVDRLPLKVQPYVYLTRVDKPIGTLLLFYPCGLSMFLHSRVAEITDTNAVSLVNHYGLIRVTATDCHTLDLYRTIWTRCSCDAWCWMHYQRYVGQRP